MSKHQAINFSTPSSELFGGGAIFVSGPYEVIEADFRMYDFKRPGNDSLCAYMKLQPLDAEGEASGDEVERFWPLNAKGQDGTIYVEPITPIKGRKGAFSQITLTDSSFGKLSGSSDFMYLHKSAEQAEVDMDAVGNDFSGFEGMKLEFGLLNKPAKAKTAVEEAEGAGDGEKKPNYPKQVVVITGTVGTKKKAAKKTTKPADDDEEAKPAKKAAKKPAAEPETAEEWLKAYLEAEVCTAENDDEEVGHTDHRLNVPKWLAKRDVEPAMVKKVMAIYNDVEDGLPSVLETLGWKYKLKSKSMVKAA